MILFVFLDTECTQDRDWCFEHVPNLICAEQICSKSEDLDDLSVGCEKCGKPIQEFWQDSVGKFIDYLR